MSVLMLMRRTALLPLVGVWLLSTACAGSQPKAHQASERRFDSNVEVEVVFDAAAHLVTTFVAHNWGVDRVEPTRARHRLLYLSLPTGRQEVLISQVFEEWLNMSPMPGGGESMTGGVTVGGGCYGQAAIDVAPSAEYKLRHHVHDESHCELECLLKSANQWVATPCNAPALRSEATATLDGPRRP